MNNERCLPATVQLEIVPTLMIVHRYAIPAISLAAALFVYLAQAPFAHSATCRHLSDAEIAGHMERLGQVYCGKLGATFRQDKVCKGLGEADCLTLYRVAVKQCDTYFRRCMRNTEAGRMAYFANLGGCLGFKFELLITTGEYRKLVAHQCGEDQ